ncbi:DUF4245 domain-containing protein [Nocardioides anomalus]|uniref:DUF4245 domain-containing protein n=1 Tax=Nocardioides anomalus TaxID=2712223 RepID=A0A6G6WGK7_9ACTN|nr:DUF4245 domain-containing protein [Nocardioides anomalus]QIG44293.1 DUF4245 domain-containing protein [Nocardioides anomalus]
MSDTPEQGRERPSRYTRSFGGLIGAMVVTVVFIAGYVAFRAVTRDQPDVKQDVDYLAQVSELQGADVTVVFPCGLPDGWRATSTDFERGDPPTWGIGFVTDDDEFVGVRQEQSDVDDLLETYVDKSADEGEDASPENSLGVSTWQTWSDDGGDHAFSTTLAGPLDGQTLLVYGSASVAQQEELVGRLSTGSTQGC